MTRYDGKGKVSTPLTQSRSDLLKGLLIDPCDLCEVKDQSFPDLRRVPTPRTSKKASQTFVFLTYYRSCN